MKSQNSSTTEYRLDLRGKGGKATRVGILVRQRGDKWRRCDGDFTNEHVTHYRKFARVAAAVARAVAPALDAKAILRGVNSQRRSKRKARKPPRRRLIRGGNAPEVYATPAGLALRPSQLPGALERRAAIGVIVATRREVWPQLASSDSERRHRRCHHALRGGRCRRYGGAAPYSHPCR